MLFLHRVPAPPLDAFIESVWYCENLFRPHATERILPTGAAQLIINLKENQTRQYDDEAGACTTSPGSILAGMRSRFCVIDTAEQECVMGVAFRPGGTLPFFRVSAGELRDQDVSLDLLWGYEAEDLRTCILEARDAPARMEILERALARRCALPGLPPILRFAIRTMTRSPHDISIAAVTAQTGLSPKRFIERFETAVGMTPKRFCRILRFQRALAEARRAGFVDWTRVAVDCGYFDQAHFIHDFRSFSGITPTAYGAGRTEFQNHVKILQSPPPLL